MRILQIKQAEYALADGRLDEACELIAREDLRSHRQGQELVGRLVRELLDRAAKHLEAGHERQALADCEKAVALGGNLPEAAELRSRVAEAIARRQQDNRRQGELVGEARRHVEDGRLSAAEALLADTLADGGQAEALRREAAARRAAAEAAMGRAEAALARGDHAAAMDELLTARAERADNDGVAKLAGRVVGAAAAQIRGDLARGRLDLAEPLLGRLGPLAGARMGVTELAGAMRQCRRAWAAERRGEFRRAAEALRLIQVMLPDAAWAADAATAAEAAATACEALRAGPLGMLAAGSAHGGDSESCPAADTLPSDARPREQPMELTPVDDVAGGTRLPGKFLLRMDGAGCSMVIRQDCLTLGPISSPQKPDLGLLADPSVPVVTIERTEGDYFLRCDAPVDVNGRPTTGKLLADGDKIGLSPRCRLRFRLPMAASSTAVLELSTARLPQADVRRIVLLDREVVLGADPAAHIRAEGLAQRAVLHLRDGRLVVRTDAAVTVDHKPLPPDAALPMDRPIRLGAVGLVVDRA